MADVVQYRLERMVNELDDLEKRGLFNRREIAEIVKKRRDFEYRIKRPGPLKEDFISYIDYEAQVDSLRDLRKQAIVGKLKEQRMEEEEEEEEEDKQEKGSEGRRKRRKKKKYKGEKLWKRSISDVAGVMRILDIYKKATFRYKGDLDLWFRYLEFCREQRHGRMKQALIQAIRFHPKVPGLWIYAAAWEFDQNLNAAAARALMHNGLRVCRESEDLWVEYLRMELTYLYKLKARKAALGEDVDKLTRSGDSKEMEKWKEENKDLFMPLNEDKEEANELDLQEVALEKKENFFWEQGSNILRTIYQGAIEALPSSMSFRKRFLEILDEVDLAHSDELKGEVMEDLRRYFSKDESYWDWLAKFQVRHIELKNSEKEEVLPLLDKAIQVYEDALEILPSTKMFSLYINFLLDIIVPERLEGTLEFSSHLLKVYERAESSGCLTKDLAQQFISFYLQLGKIEEARGLAGRLCEGSLSQAAKLWVLRASIEITWLSNKSGSMSDTDLNTVFELLRSALAKSIFSEAETLWLMAFKIFYSRKKHFKMLVDEFVISMARAGIDGSGCSVSSAILSLVIQRDGIQRTRDIYKRFLALPHPGLRFFKHCIELESNLAFVGDNNALVNARKVYESALNIYGHIRELWKDYYDLELKAGTSATANAVYWRARKSLRDTTGFSASSCL